MKPSVVKLLSPRIHFTCEMCGTTANSKMYQYQAISMVPGYKPRLFNKMCRKCTYREIYGSKNYNKRMKEGVLDGES